MKKLLAVFSCVLLTLTCLLGFGCKPKNENLIRLSEVTHSTFYAPLYVAINQGFFEDEGITIELTSGEGADKVMAALTSGSVDVGFMGPEAVVYCQINGQKDYPVVFGQLTKRDGSFLVSKSLGDEFDWNDLKGKRLLAGRKGGMPAMTLQYVLNQKGIQTSDLNFDTSVSFGNMAGVFQADDTVDFTTLFEPTASEVQALGKGKIVASIGKESGEVPYTAFATSKSTLKNKKDKLKAFLRAVVKGYRYVAENDAKTVARALAPSFDGISVDSLAVTIESYLTIDAWSSHPAMTQESFERLQDIMQNAGELSKRADYAKLVDNTLANEVMTEFST